MQHLQFLVLVVNDLKEEHPAQLADALRIAIDAGVLAHDVLDRFDDGADRHGLRDFLIEGVLQIVDGLLEAALAAERVDELDDAAHRAERGDLQHVRVVEIEHAFVLDIWRAAHRARRGLGRRIW